MAHPLMSDPDEPALVRLRELCAAYPEADEFVSHGRPCFRTGEKGRIFAAYGAGRRTAPGEHGRVDTAVSLRIDEADLPGIDADPRFFVPMYAGRTPWRAVDMGTPDADWEELAELLDASYRLLAPRRLIALLDAGSDG